MNSTTLLALAGIGGTLFGAVVGAAGTLGSARITSRAQTGAEEQRARRQAYSACATAFLARRDAVAALLDVFRSDDFDAAAVRARLQEVDEQRDAVARAVGAVAIEGPHDVAHGAEWAAKTLELLAGRLRDWTAEVAGGRDRDDLLRSQLQFAVRYQADTERMIDRFTAVCRRVLHPAESDGIPRGRLRRLLRRY
ncbi:hypothetical protein OG564_10810 [Streptomyces sp. NBC_01280]|uniref:hypothetical protein n=1 Tax=Streptomyces sp. NBC_01280 TaxID=2903810 RepID=UPI002E3752F2|nr:hypothetical protein [Streptomyces sp. NBC_01280]